MPIVDILIYNSLCYTSSIGLPLKYAPFQAKVHLLKGSTDIDSGLYYTIIDFNEVDMRVYLPGTVIFTEVARPM